MKRTTAEVGELYAAYRSDLNRYMLYLTRNREEAADLVQEVFLRLCQQERLPERAKEWMASTGYRLFVDRWRRSRRIRWQPLDRLELRSPHSPEQAYLDQELAEAMRLLLPRFQSRRRSVLTLRLYKQYSCREIARVLGCSENTVKSDIRRGKRQLSQWLSDPALSIPGDLVHNGEIKIRKKGRD
ncbi:RNA polymerase sigma factor [Cohnella hongkongensis]|uniref:RNA polymerase sigma factor n=1 Tax=Cohnella hongkongensis TaxID=178337 RepID=A0ABV9FFZ0_9BACL